MSAKITADVKFGARKPCPFDEEPKPGRQSWPHNGWTVTLRYRGRRLTVDFYTGPAAAEPDAASVMECLASDASSVANARGFEDWCSEYGYDTDSRKAERTFKTCAAQTAKLRVLLGDDFDALVYADEDAIRAACA